MSFQVNRIEKKKAYREIVEEIWQAIKKHSLAPGDKLPPERELSHQLNVGRPTLREGLSVLDYLGIVESVQGGGYYVKSVTHLDLSAHLASINRNVSPYSIITARLTLEPEVCKLSARTRTEEDLNTLAGIVNQIKKGVKQGIYPKKEDRGFHTAIADTTGNPLLGSMVKSLLALTDQLVYQAIQSTGYRFDLRLHDFQSDHEAIFRAIKNQDEKEAYRAMRSHLLRVKRDMFSGWEEENEHSST